MAFWKTLFGGGKVTETADKIITGGISAIDKLVFTEEEKHDARMQVFSAWVKMHEIAGDEQTSRSVTRRILAIIFCAEYALLVLVLVAAKAIGSDAFADFVFKTMNDLLFWIVGGVITFYFVPYGVTSVMKAKNGK